MTRQTTLDEIGTWWAIRITVEELELEKTEMIFKHYEKYIISEEGDGEFTRVHHHVILVTEEDSNKIKENIRKVYPKATGNKCIYCRPAKDKRQLAKYTLKEDNYIYKGFSEEFIKIHFKLAVAKTDLKKDLIKIEEDYVLGKVTTEQFTQQYIELKVKYDQPLYTNHVVSYIRKMMVRSGNMTSKLYAKQIISQIEYNN